MTTHHKADGLRIPTKAEPLRLLTGPQIMVGLAVVALLGVGIIGLHAWRIESETERVRLLVSSEHGGAELMAIACASMLRELDEARNYDAAALCSEIVKEVAEK
ncbi:MAG: hypothetical protein AAFR28_16695 [Pseudomonadota bacterium]